MGRFVYENVSGDAFSIEDRTLFHLERAISTKLRRGESFALVLHASFMPAGQGHRVFWIDPNVPLQFTYDGSLANIRLNPAWLEALVSSSYGDMGMLILPEPTGPSTSELRG